MLPKNFQKLYKIGGFLAVMGMSAPLYAQTIPDAGSMIANIAAQIPNLQLMVTAIAYVMGFFFVISGIMKLKHVGESRSMMSSDRSIKEPLVYISVGTILIWLPSAFTVATSTFWAEPSPYAYLPPSDQFADIINAIFLIIQFVGVIAFIRGLVILSSLAHHSGGGQNPFGKGLTYLISGIFCINIWPFVQMIEATLGIST